MKQEIGTGSYLEAHFASILLCLKVVYFCVDGERILWRNEFHFINCYFEPFWRVVEDAISIYCRLLVLQLFFQLFG